MLLGFKQQFSPPILNGSKGFTLRLCPKRMPKIGEKLHMYIGLRTKACVLITNQFNLLGIEDVHLIIIDPFLQGSDFFGIAIKVNGKTLTDEEKNLFYVMDGFADRIEFLKYWTENFKRNSVEEHLKMFRWQELPFSH